MTSIYHIAKATGVNVSTVSRVLNNHTSQVSAATRARILQAMRDLDYRPIRAPRRRKGSLTVTAGILASVPNASYSAPGYYSSLHRAVLEQCDVMTINLTVFAASLFQLDPQDSIRTYCDGRCDGLIVFCSETGDLVRSLIERGFPTVIIGDQSSGQDVSWCDIDNYQSAYDVTTYLIGQGHGRIGVCQGNRMRSTIDRIRGYQQAMADAGLAMDSSWISPECRGVEQMDAWLSDLIGPDCRIATTAIMGLSDSLAVDILARLKARGLSVPTDVSLVGFDDTLAASATPRLTTVRQPYEAMAKWALEALVRRIGDPDLRENIIFSGETIYRESVGKVAK